MASPPAPKIPAPLFKTDVRASELLQALEAHAPHLRALSLDCFDTLLWRNTHQPIDVFFDLQNDPSYQRIGLSAQRRIDSESEARKYNFIRRGLTEVKLTQIYSAESTRLPITAADTEALVEAELRAEERALYFFPPVVELIRAAKAKGLEVVVVSDTYLTEALLRRLLAHALPAEVLAMIDRVFCSCEHGRSKQHGLLEIVAQQLKRKPAEMLHVGDNTVADFFAPRAIGMHAAHLVHHDAPTEQILRMQTLAYSMQHAPARHTEAIPSPYRGLLASVTRPDSPVNALGYTSLGPLIYSFARWLLDELEELKAAGKKVKPLFLMRDGYLPQEVCKALLGTEFGAPISLSRFVSIAASFRSQLDIEEYLMRFTVAITHRQFEPVLKQLMLPGELAKKITEKALKSTRPDHEFCKQILERNVTRVIYEKSKSYRQRLYKHVEHRAGLTRGDTFVFVDLGYAGTGQRLLRPAFKDEFDIDIIGRYLLVTPTPGWESDRKGLIDASTCDNRSLFALIPNISLLEDLCTTNIPSVVDFDSSGDPIEGKLDIAPAQFERLKPIQANAIEFAKDAQSFFNKVGKHPSRHELKAVGLGALTRMLFFPGEPEIAALEGFQFDINLATTDTYHLFDRAQGLLGLQRRGLPSMEQHEGFRTNYPIELRAAHLSLAVTALAADRNSLSFNRADLTHRRETIPVVFLRGAQDATIPTDAIATYDGYYSLIVPFGDGSFKAGILFGQVYSWIQIESIQAIPNSALFSKFEARHAVDVRASVKLEQMVERAPGLFECTSPGAFMLPLPPKPDPAQGRQQLACRIVYRPISARKKP